MKALILVDLQNDFMPGGSLAVNQGQETVDVANRLMGSFDWVVATQDFHPDDHGSFATQHPGGKPGDMIELDGLPQVLWPDHCVNGTEGAEFHKDLDMKGIDKIFQKGTDINVDSYSGLYDNGRRKSTGLSEWLKYKNVDTVMIMGLATDYCVKFTALDAQKDGFKTQLILDGSRGVELNAGDIDNAIEEMKSAGVQMTQSDDVLLNAGN